MASETRTASGPGRERRGSETFRIGHVRLGTGECDLKVDVRSLLDCDTILSLPHSRLSHERGIDMYLGIFACLRGPRIAAGLAALILSGAPAAASAAPVTAAVAAPATRVSSHLPIALPAASPVAETTRCGGGQLKLGQIISCGAITGERVDTFRITTTVDNDTLLTMLIRSTGDWVQGSITDPQGNQVCGVGVDAGTCQLGAAGDYQLRLLLAYGQGSGNYTVCVDSTRTPSDCRKLPESLFSFASAGLALNVPFGSAGRCLLFDQPQGAVLLPQIGSASGGVQGRLLDGRFDTQCALQSSVACTLDRPGPYHLYLYEPYGAAVTFTLRMPRLSGSVGCPAVVAPGAFGDRQTGVFSGTVTTSWVTCAKVKAPAAGNVAVRFDPAQYLWWTVYDDAGRQVCDKYTHERACPLPTAGDFTVIVQNQNYFGQPVDFRFAVTALYADAGCAPVTGTSWDLPALLVHQTSGVQVNCQPFHGEAGDRIVIYTSPTVYNDVSAVLVDSSGAQVCSGYSEQDGCVLPAGGTYRVVSRLWNWDASVTDATYKLQVRRLSSPEGCPTVTPGAYNAAPAGALSTIRCRILDIPAAGRYRLKAVDATNYETYAQVYDVTGVKVCGSQLCDFPSAGRYTMVLRGSELPVIDELEYVVALLPEVPSGCPQLSGDPANPAFHRGLFQTAGQFDCVQIAGQPGAKILELLPGDATGAARPEVTIVDATGAYVCTSQYSLRQYTCELTGTAPFFAISTPPSGTTPGAYAQAFPQVSGDSGCPALPRTAEGTVVSTGPDRFTACFSVAADQHAARETFTFRRLSGTGDAQMAVLTTSGIIYCGSLLFPSTDRTFTCTLPAGPLTVLLEADPVDATYLVTHRDASTPAP
jgi:hypothetical protein